jgi:hypothetical protein
MELTCAIHYQVYHQRFLKSALNDYAVRRTIHRYISQRYLGELNADIEMIPYDKRDHKFVVVTTYQLLGERHAPTRFALSLCHHLQSKLGYKVLLLVIGEPVTIDKVSPYWTGDIIMPNYLDRWYSYSIDYHDQHIKCFQIDINQASRDDMLSFIGEIYGMRPEFI